MMVDKPAETHVCRHTSYITAYITHSHSMQECIEMSPRSPPQIAMDSASEHYQEVPIYYRLYFPTKTQGGTGAINGLPKVTQQCNNQNGIGTQMP